ncbi:adenylate/guanylate cyclase family protein [Paenibacillus taihuensis]|uniref:Adenylate/guanylate cyclase family protein n=1 Tax=Paenibacillus taihuensis TaxID=1156355 RepID=A0A3D9RWX6_9BACL|nr:adenylate/guanylate cyclase domain-containing protein [Paenibacillus taihuensis]REE81586.1 adenylate/guanylate cyclase family protein [Paenibacillus taihuensis]
MSLERFRNSLREEVQIINASEFDIIIKETTTVPTITDSEITYSNLDTKEQKCKLIETCILYIDIRNSTDLNLTHRRETMAKLYSSFVRAMARAGGYYNGKVRNIIGDRIMVVFDSANCFTNAVDTAILMNSISQYVLNKEFPHNEIKCGIGIDYGKMLVTKAGIIKNGSENDSHKSLVWLGRPANVASKLTDAANKSSTETRTIVTEGYYYPLLEDKWLWIDRELEEFIDNFQTTSSQSIRHKSSHFDTFYKNIEETSQTNPPILMTKAVYDGFKRANPDRKCIKENYFKSQPTISVQGFKGDIYGGNVHFTVFNE